MDTRLQNLSKASSPSSSPVQTGLFQSRPSLEPEQESAEAIDSSHQPPDLQTQLDTAARFGYNFSRVQVQSHTPSVIQQQPVNGESEEQQDEQEYGSVAERDKIMAPPIGNPIQRKSFEEEPIQMMPQLGLLTPRIQRESFEEEPIQMMPQLGLLTPRIQRESLEEEPIQMMPQLGLLTPRIQRESLEEEPIQMQPQLAMLQRLPQEEDESPIQMMPQLGIIQRREAEVDEEPIQMQRIQLKVVVGQPGDKYEQEADSVAAQVMSMSVPTANLGLVQRQGEEEETPLVQRSPLADSITPLVQRHAEEQEEPIQTKSLLQRAGAKGNAEAGTDLENKLSSSKGGGSPLADDVRSFMEPRFGVDFSSVRVHTDSTAVQMNKDLGAQAFAHGSDIYYGAGKSPAQDNLTAHELTHVVQQTGAKTLQRQEQIEPEADQAADTAEWMPEDSTTENVAVFGLSQDIGIQRLCSQCLEEQQQLAEEEKAEKTLQAKELAGYTPEVASTNTERPSSSPQAQTEAKEKALEAKEEAAKSDELEEPQSVKIVPQREPSAAAAESVADTKAGDESNPVAEAMEATTPPDAIELPKEATPQIEGDKTKGEKGAQTTDAGKGAALEGVPETQALEQSVAKDESANLNPEGSGKAASPETVAQKEEAIANATAANAKLEATNAEAAQLASTGISFALPQQEETANANDGLVISRKADNSGGDLAFIEQQRAAASSMASGFLANAAGRVQTITSFGQTITPSIQSAAESAKAAIMATIAQQRAAVTTQIAQVRAQAQSEAQAALAQIGSQHQAAVAAIKQTTTASRTKVETGYTTALTTVDERETSQLKRIDELYAQADKAYRAAGTKVGGEAVEKGEQKAKGFESQVKGEDDSLLDGPVTDDKLKARAKAARDVAGQYKQGLIEEANKQADAGQKGKSKDIEAVRKAATDSRKTLESQHKATLDSLNASQEQALSQAQQAQTSLTQSANKTLETTLQSLKQQEAAQLQILADYGQRQILAIDRDSQKAIASLQDGVNQAASNLQSTLQEFQGEMQGIAAPDPQALSAVLAETLGQIDGAIATVQGQLDQGIAASVQGITQGNQQTLQALTSMGQGAIGESTAAGQGLTTTLTGLTQGATDTFTQLQQTHTTTVTKSADTAVEGFGKVTDGVKTLFDQIDKNLENGFKDSAKGLEDGLRGALVKMDADIQKYGDEAAAQVQPRWKGILKIILVIAVIVVVAMVVGPAVIGAVGAAAGALGVSAATASAVGAIVGGAIVGAASGAVIQMGNNVIDGKNLMDGVGKAALVGAIGGALGGAGGVLGNALVKGARLTQSLLKVGIDMALDTAGNILGDLATGNPITLEGILTGAAMGLAMSVGMGQLSKIKSIEGIQGKSFQVGEGVGGYAGGKIKSGFGGGMDVPTSGRPDVDLPNVKQPDVEVKAPETEVKPPKTEVKTPETEVKAPETEVKAPETEVKAPETEVKTPETEVKAPETEVKAPETEVKTPETEVKAPETEVKAPETEVKASETDIPNGRTTHPDEPEVEPGVVAKEQTPDGHEIKVLKDGRVVRCSECGEIRNKYADQLEQNPDFKQRLDEIEKIPDPQEKARQAQQLEQELAQTIKNQEPEVKAPDQKRKSEESPESGESSTKKAKTDEPEIEAKKKAEFRKRIDEAKANGNKVEADNVRYERYLDECKQEGRTPKSRDDWQVATDRLRANQARGRANEDAALESAGVQNNNYAQTPDGTSRDLITYTTSEGVVTRPDGVTDSKWVDVKSVEEGTVYYTEQLRAQKEGALSGHPDGTPRDLAVVIANKDPKAVRPSGPLADDAIVVHRNSETEQWSVWDKRANEGQGGWTPINPDQAASALGGKIPDKIP